VNDHDLPAFLASFQQLRQVFPLRANPSELDGIVRIYFNTLKRHPIRSVETAAERLIASGQHFPKPAQWLEAVPRSLAAIAPEMSPRDAEEHQRAIALSYEDEPCNCIGCTAAGVSHRFPRYVPDIDEYGRDVRMVLGGSIVARGHWAHGEELAQFYAAKDQFWADYLEQVKRLRKMSRVTHEHVEAEADERSVEASLDRAEIGAQA
jgi:hypothetical protein